MSTQVNEICWALTEKEKQTLRLIVRGHDAKSVARSLNLSVHTINERLRDARRKMAVSSSREAARLLLAAEGEAGAPDPDLSGDTEIGADVHRPQADQASAPVKGVERTLRFRIITGVCLMTLAIGLFALLALSEVPTNGAPPTPATASATVNAEVVDVARKWLGLVDQSRWDESYRGTSPAFRKLNTAKVWAATSEQVRAQFGAVISRTFLSQENFPAPPAGYEVVKFGPVLPTRRTRWRQSRSIVRAATGGSSASRSNESVLYLTPATRPQTSAASSPGVANRWPRSGTSSTGALASPNHAATFALASAPRCRPSLVRRHRTSSAHVAHSLAA